MSAERTEPQVVPTANGVHSPIALPALFKTWGSFRLEYSADFSNRRPEEPVSTITWSIVWQAAVARVVPGAQTVTDT